ncbi:aquaporin-like [Scaptodrosophila lebanonensis]|uniref:Aquaporin-like n=1 Tax=Drosophila lebanonensis TaxID=7225 RepID=A0A6J2TWW7_DROLE|nr:aquaporin-like [Scaptodrosophila lebanonensis]
MKVTKKLIAAILGEFLASLIVQFVGCLGSTQRTLLFPSSLGVAFSWGCSVLAATQIFRIVSGAHINPCISIASMILKQVKIVQGLIYILMQFLGSTVGFFIAYAFQESTTGFCNASFHESSFRFWKALLIEAYLTGAWVLAMCASWHPSNELLSESISLRIGLVVTACHIIGATSTGPSMNPFRSLVPAVMSEDFDFIYIYMVVPPVTAILLALAWRFIYVYNGNKSTVSEAPSTA